MRIAGVSEVVDSVARPASRLNSPQNGVISCEAPACFGQGKRLFRDRTRRSVRPRAPFETELEVVTMERFGSLFGNAPTEREDHVEWHLWKALEAGDSAGEAAAHAAAA